MKKFKTIILFTIISAVSLLPVFSQSRVAGKRVALVIGNENYKSNPLNNPVNDAKAFQKKLKELNFDVIEAYNTDSKKMKETLKAFYTSAQKADLALLYYSGHGIECEGKNYLIPVGEEFEDDVESFDANAVNLQNVMNKIEATECSQYIVILDACRDNPIKKSRGGGSRGITTVPTSSSCEGIIFYSCATGTTADDGDGKHSPFTEALLNHITEQNVSFTKIVQDVTKDVKAATKNRQAPYTSGSITSDIFLNGKPESVDFYKEDNIRPDNSNSLKVSIILFVIFFIAMIVCFIVFTEKGQKVALVAKNKTMVFKNQTSDFTMRTVSTIKEKAKANQEKKKEKQTEQTVQTPSCYLDSVLIDKRFYCSLSPVTVLQYREVSGKSDYDQNADADDPVTNISYFEAAQFMNALSSKDKLECVYDLSNPQNIKMDKTKNGWRLPDEAEWKRAAYNNQFSNMMGVVWQWCNDTEKNKYVLKGGSWDSPKNLINADSRMMVIKEFKSDAVGMIGVRNK